MPQLKDLFASRAQTWESLKAVQKKAEAENRAAFTAAETAELKKYEAELERVTRDIEAIQSHDESMRNLTSITYADGSVGFTEDVREGQPLAREQRMVDWARSHGQVPDEHRSLDLGRYLRGMVTGEWKDADAERRAMGEGVLSGGGYMVPSILSTQIIDKARNQARVMQAGAQLFPMENSTVAIARWAGDPAPAYHAENTVITQSDATVEQVLLKAKTSAVLTLVSRELIEDSDEATGASVTAALENAFGAQMALTIDNAALYGTGVDPIPRGVKATTGVTVVPLATNGALPGNYDWVIAAVGTLRGFNEEPNGVIYAPRTEQELATLKDTQGRYLTAPASLDSLPRYTTNQVPTNLTVGTGTTTSDAFIGDWSQLYIGMRTSYQLTVLRERYADFGQVGFLGWMRFDIAVARPKAFVVETGIL